MLLVAMREQGAQSMVLSTKVLYLSRCIKLGLHIEQETFYYSWETSVPRHQEDIGTWIRPTHGCTASKKQSLCMLLGVRADMLLTPHVIFAEWFQKHREEFRKHGFDTCLWFSAFIALRVLLRNFIRGLTTYGRQATIIFVVRIILHAWPNHECM